MKREGLKGETERGKKRRDRGNSRGEGDNYIDIQTNILPCTEMKEIKTVFFSYYAAIFFKNQSTLYIQHGGITYQCEHCEFTTAHTGSLKSHIERKHTKTIKKYPCDQCSFTTPSTSTLKYHKKVKHEGIIYSCDSCKFTTNRRLILKNHINFEHKGGTYHPCNICEYISKSPQLLKRHNKSIHGGVASDEAKHEAVTYPCDLCDYTATNKNGVIMHKAVKHEKVKYLCDQCEFTTHYKGRVIFILYCYCLTLLGLGGGGNFAPLIF